MQSLWSGLVKGEGDSSRGGGGDLANSFLGECCCGVPVILIEWIFDTNDWVVLAEALVCLQQLSSAGQKVQQQ